MKTKGTYTQIDNWVLEVVAGLTLASDIKILLRLARQVNYRKIDIGTAALADELGLDIRTVQQACKRLADAGHICSDFGLHFLSKCCTRVAQPLRKSTRPQQGAETVQEKENPPLKEGKEEEGREGKEKGMGMVQGIDLGTPPAPKPTHTFPDFQSSFSQLIHLIGDKASVSAMNVGGGQNAVIRWVRDYPADFIIRAYQLAPSYMAHYQKPRDVYVFVGWLNRELRYPWPQELVTAYAELTSPTQPTQQAHPVQQEQDLADILKALPLEGGRRWKA